MTGWSTYTTGTGACFDADLVTDGDSCNSMAPARGPFFYGRSDRDGLYNPPLPDSTGSGCR